MDANRPGADPTQLLRYRDSIYAADLLICAVAHLDFFTYLEPAPRYFEAICRDLAIVPRPTDVMVSLFRAMGLVVETPEGCALTPQARRHLVSGVPDSLAPYYASLKNRPPCREFYEVLRTGVPAGWSSEQDGQDWLAAMRDPAFADAFTLAMDSRGAFLSQALAGTLDLEDARSLLDVAGGSGIYACALAAANPALAAAVFEIPPVDEATRRSIAARGMAERVRVAAGDMFAGLPGGYDAHLFANVLHDWDWESNRKLAARSFQALEPGGRIVIFDAHLNEAKDGPLAVAEYSCLLMHSTVGRCYSTGEMRELLTEAGFVDVRVQDVAASRSVITARKA